MLRETNRPKFKKNKQKKTHKNMETYERTGLKVQVFNDCLYEGI